MASRLFTWGKTLAAATVGLSVLMPMNASVAVEADVNPDKTAKPTAIDEASRAPVVAPLSSVFIRQDQGGSAQFNAYAAALIAQSSQDQEKSSDYFMSAVEADPGNRHVLTRAFYQLLFASRIADAGDVAAKLTDLPSESALQDNLIFQLAVLDHLAKGRYDSAITRLQEWQVFNNRNVVLSLLIAWAEAAKGNGEEAFAILDQVVDTRDTYAGLLAVEHAAYIADYLGMVKEARTRYLAITTHPRVSSLQPFIQYAAFLYRSEGAEAASSQLAAYAKRFKTNSYLIRQAGRIARGLGATHDPRQLRQAIALLFFRLGSELSNGDARQAAIVYLQMADYLRPGSADTLILLGALLEEQKDHDTAAAVYNRVSPDEPLYRHAHMRYIEALRVAGDTETLTKAVADAIALNPSSAELNVLAGDIAREAGDFDQALERYNRVIKLQAGDDQNNWYAYFARGVTYDQMGQWEEAEADFLQSLTLKKNQATVQNYLGYSWIDRGINMDKGRDLIRQALLQDPDDGFINDSLGWVNFLSGDYQAAVLYLEQAVRIEAGDATIHHHLGDAYWQVGRQIEARFQWQHALDADPTDKERDTLLRKLRDGLVETDLKGSLAS